MLKCFSEKDLAAVGTHPSSVTLSDSGSSDSMKAELNSEEDLGSDRGCGSSAYNVSPDHSGGELDDDSRLTPLPGEGQAGYGGPACYETAQKSPVACTLSAVPNLKQLKGTNEPLKPLKQSELATLSIFIGSNLPQLTLMLGLDYTVYENVSTSEKSQEAQCLHVLMKWYQSGRGERKELAEALRRSGHGRISKL